MSTSVGIRPEVVVFHSVLGLRPAIHEWAAELRAAGYVVHVPDLYDGAVFDDFDAGFRHVAAIGGIPTLVARSRAAVADLPADLVFAGFSNGAASAELLAATRPGARGAILMHGVLPIEAFGVTTWPAEVPVQLHQTIDDPFRAPSNVDAFVATVRSAGAPIEQYDYPGHGHLFADSGLSDYDRDAAALMLQRVLTGLHRMHSAS